MRLVGVLVILAGWLVAMSGLFFSTANGVRIAFALAGIGISLYGMLGVLNGYYVERAIWKK